MTRGLQMAGYHVTGVDLYPQPNYVGDHFVQADVIEVLCQDNWWVTYDAVFASPPCQAYSAMSSCRPGLAERYPKLIGPIRSLLEASPIPWVIENVPGAPLKRPIELCGQMFGLDLYRHRLFESNIRLEAPWHPKHVKPASRAGHWEPGTVMSVAGHVAPIAHARKIMGIDWMTREELGEAIPPRYAQFIGAQLLQAISAAA